MKLEEEARNEEQRVRDEEQRKVQEAKAEARKKQVITDAFYYHY